MEVRHERCCGAVVSQDFINACILMTAATGGELRIPRTFTAFTQELHALDRWLQENAVTHIAVKAAGSAWTPLWRVIHSTVEFVLVDDERLQAPPRHTRVPECEWLADLLRHDLIPRRELLSPDSCYHDCLCRYRARLQEQRQLWSISIQDVLKAANVRLSSVLSDVMGESGRAILQAVLGGEYDSERLAQLAKGRLRSKIPQLKLALEGQLDDRQRFLLREWLDLWTILGTKLEHTEQELRKTAVSVNARVPPGPPMKIRRRPRAGRTHEHQRHSHESATD
jgi:hypothetical protein